MTKMSKSILLAFPAFAAAAALSTPTAGDFVRELRGAKTALLRGVAAEGGALSEDALALMDGLGRVNPSAPNPAADVDLWANDYDVRSRLPLPPQACVQICASSGCARRCPRRRRAP